MSAPQLSIVIPVYNEEAIVEQAAKELCAGLDTRGWDYEIIFAENGSRDRTQEILERLTKASAVKEIQEGTGILFLDSRYYSPEFGLSETPDGKMEVLCG